MSTKYIGSNGQELSLNSSVELIDAIKRGVLTAATMVYDERSHKWVRADVHPECVAVLSAPTLVGDASEVKQTSRKRGMSWLLFAAGIAVIVAGSLLAGLGSDKAAELFGESIPYGLIAAAIAYAVTPKGKDRHASANRNLWAGIAYLSICAFLLLKAISDASQIRADAASIQTRMDKLVDLQTRVANGTAVLKAPTGPLPQVSAEQTDLQKIGVLLDRSAQRNASIGAAYQQALRDAKFDSILLPETLTSARARARALGQLLQMSAAIDAWDQETAKSMEEFRQEIESLGLSPASLQQAISGYEKGLQAGTQFRKDYANVERSIVKAAREIVTLAETSNPQIGHDGRQLLFAKGDDANRYNELLQQIQSLGTRETELLSQQANRTRKISNDFKSQVAQVQH
jgi:hypothetical protein